MRKRIAILASLTLIALPALAVPTASNDLTVDEFLLSGVVSTQLVSAVRCPVPTLGCGSVDQDCGVTPGVCHCKAGGGTLTCVKNPGGGGPIE